ncbi:MAG: hypothetical protein E6J08_00445 [Chloroflexi bacterium]|nr:MAG: hypothetical protein E6J08_00445 [Chloroflexota bacterium]
MSKLLPGENLVLKDHPHWITVVGSLILPAVLVIAVVIADFTIFSPNNVNSIYVPHLRTFLSLGIAALALLWLMVVWIGWRSITYSIIGRIFGYGRVEIDAAGAQGAEVLDYLPKPGEFRDQVFIQSEKRRGGGTSAAPTGAHVPANSSGV